jgi:hypothetical protein
MRHLYLALLLTVYTAAAAQQPPPKSPCLTDPVYRQFDFWIGTWEVYGKNGQKAGDSRIEIILDSCIVLENWTSANGGYAGKSFNTYNAVSRQWQQTWVDNRGGSTEFLEGRYEQDKMIFLTKPYAHSRDTMAIRRLTFYNLAPDKVRQHGEISKDGARSWSTEYDLEYRRRKE